MPVPAKPIHVDKAVPARVRRLSRPDLATGCWDWIGHCERQGYGRIKIGGRRGRSVSAHRVAYLAFIGPIPDGMEIDHLCRNRRRVNPDHLEAVTTAENVQRSWDSRKRGEAPPGVGPVIRDGLDSALLRSAHAVRIRTSG